jgi:acetoin utilization protein AcuB
MKISQVMTRRVMTVDMDDSLRRVRDIFEEHSFHHLLVLDRRRVVGVISDRDLLKHISPFIGKLAERSQDLSTLTRRVHQIMTRKLVSVKDDEDVDSAAALMLEHGVSCLPVVTRDGRPVGIVTAKDLLRFVMNGD